jgi:uncharacterized DUF497 family protein
VAASSRYDWDVGNLEKCQQHGVTIAEIEQVLASDPFIVPDHAHSDLERRRIAVGKNRSGRPVFVVFTIRVSASGEVVRPISARYMHRKEIKRYEHLWREKGPPSED